jgi:hypothetical protein
MNWNRNEQFQNSQEDQGDRRRLPEVLYQHEIGCLFVELRVQKRISQARDRNVCHPIGS